MGLVKYALKFRATFYVLAILILVAGVAAIIVTPKDALPTVDIPVVTIVWTYTGLDTPDMEQKVTTYTEFALSNNVNGIRRMQSTTLQSASRPAIIISRSAPEPSSPISTARSW